MPLIIRELLIHEGEKILKYSGFIYADDDMSHDGALLGLRKQVIRMTQEDIPVSESLLEEMGKDIRDRKNK